MSYEYINSWNNNNDERVIINFKGTWTKLQSKPFHICFPGSCSVCGKDSYVRYPGFGGKNYCPDHLEMKIIGEWFWLCRE
jgi:hypothetical protein